MHANTYSDTSACIVMHFDAQKCQPRVYCPVGRQIKRTVFQQRSLFNAFQLTERPRNKVVPKDQACDRDVIKSAADNSNEPSSINFSY